MRLLTPRPGFGAAECDGGHHVAVIVSRDGKGLAAKLRVREKKADIKKRRGLRLYDWQVARCDAAGKKPQQVLDDAIAALVPVLELSDSTGKGWWCKLYPGTKCVHVYCQSRDGDK